MHSHQQPLPTVIKHTLPHGGNIEETAKIWGCHTSDILDLSTGLHPLGPPLWLGQWLQEHAALAGHYPDTMGEPARSALADFMGVQANCVLMLAGAQAAIEILPQALKWQQMSIRQPCYSEPIRAAKRADCQIIALTQDAAWPQHSNIWLTSPHNPTGYCETFPQGRHGVFDESYMTFAERQQLKVMPQVVRLGSLTKTFCIPGLRLGYIIAEPKLIAQLQKWLPPWPTSTLASHLLPCLLPEAMQRDTISSKLRQRLQALLQQYHWQVEPSQASFVLARPQQHCPDFAKHYILTRSFPEWPNLRGWVRFGLPFSEGSWQRLTRVLQTENSPQRPTA